MSVDVRKLQVAILARPSLEMSQTVCIDWQYILSRVRVSVRHSHFLYSKNTQNLGETGSPAPVFIWMKQRPAIHQPAEPAKGGVTLSLLGATDPSNSDNLNGNDGVCARDVFAIYDNNIWPRLIMIIIKIISYKSHTLMISPQRVPG